ncbi:uracil-DNA glycosylase family protein [Marispirochaeta sp.]|uniref:uracil-DNA glycosylase family protein n=1 Tax=Marispirochaeta sp. TaxID=2038653 RepID=UPI0029C6314E|nr:uracil-DNA glycosylase family protein [Marispirochaeta sp.]
MDLYQLTEKLAAEADTLKFNGRISAIYNPLQYAQEPHLAYITKYGAGRKKVLFLGMNPGPWGMAQTGVPFGEISAVRDWLGIDGAVNRPEHEHPKRPIEGFSCQKSEVSGRRLWGLFREQFGAPEAFFHEHYVANYCPLVFMEESGKNLTPDKLPAREASELYTICDRYISGLIELMSPEFLIGIGKFAAKRLSIVAEAMPVDMIRGVTIDSVLHPSPASPAANRGWAEAARKKLYSIGIWKHED